MHLNHTIVHARDITRPCGSGGTTTRTPHPLFKAAAA